MSKKYLPVHSNGCKECIFMGHNGAFAKHEQQLICCDAPGIRHKAWKHPDKVKAGENPPWCPLINKL